MYLGGADKLWDMQSAIHMEKNFVLEPLHRHFKLKMRAAEIGEFLLEQANFTMLMMILMILMILMIDNDDTDDTDDS